MPLDDLISAEPPIFFEENSGCSSLSIDCILTPR